MKLIITQEHIDSGIQCAAGHCAIALALKEAGYSSASVCMDSIWLPGLNQIIPNDKLRDFIYRFDTAKQFCEPGEFEYEVVPWE